MQRLKQIFPKWYTTCIKFYTLFHWTWNNGIQKSQVGQGGLFLFSLLRRGDKIKNFDTIYRFSVMGFANEHLLIRYIRVTSTRLGWSYFWICTILSSFVEPTLHFWLLISCYSYSHINFRFRRTRNQVTQVNFAC